FTKNLRSDRKSKQRPFLTTVTDETAQARYVAQQILDAREAGVPLKSQAVLFRASHHSAQLEIELSRRNIPFVKYGGLKFLEAAHVKDVISIFRWCENPSDRTAGFRVLNCCRELDRAPRQRFRRSGTAAGKARPSHFNRSPKGGGRRLARFCQAGRQNAKS